MGVDRRRFLPRTEQEAVKDLAIFYGMGILLHLLPWTRSLMVAITPVFLVVTAVYVIGSLSPRQNPRVIVFVAGAFLAGFAAEVAGVATGSVFGVYRYSGALGPKLFGVPPLIGLIWCLVVLGAAVLADMLFHRRVATLVLVPLFCVAFDVVLERGAVFLGYWTWEGGTVPLRNYAA
ncbi:MAG: carotenoid biosynthesis protein, partial [Spirochaetales bacterium]|nr:carotenoid biosynthesis protein [Spirochaetales bacterium]